MIYFFVQHFNNFKYRLRFASIALFVSILYLACLYLGEFLR